MNKIDEILASAYTERDYPAAKHLTELWTKTRPLEGLRVLEATPIFRNTMTKYRALIAAATLSHRYISDRFLPDKAIDLVDEACAMIRTEIDSMPTELDVISRHIIQLETKRRRSTSQRARRSFPRNVTSSTR